MYSKRRLFGKHCNRPYPDNSIRIYECLDNVRMISKLLSSNGVIIDEISVQGENLETYFENLIGGRKNV